MEKSQNTAKENEPGPKFIVPPRLNSFFYRFLDHFAVSKNEPVMIVGDTGVGKSMFLHIFKKLFQEKNGKDSPIIEANCAHFNKDLSRSELFGHAKGAFTDATKQTKGLIGEAKDGLLILEEIGELPESVQAQLLTFIETGKYRGIGKEEDKINVRIVGATNNEQSLRNDFRHRFFPFYVPSLHERRGDILYYLAYSFPDLLPTFAKSEVLALLTYNWPGNVREINRVARLMLLNKMESDRLFPYSFGDAYREGIMQVLREKGLQDHPEVLEILKTGNLLWWPNKYAKILQGKIELPPKMLEILFAKTEFESRRLVDTDPRYTFLDANIGNQIIKRIEMWGGRSDLLDDIFNFEKVGLLMESHRKAFDFIKINGNFFPPILKKENKEIFERFEIELLDRKNELEDIYNGLIYFCNLFGQDSIKNSNILLDVARGIYDFMPKPPNYIIGFSDRIANNNLSKAIMKSLLEIKLDDDHTDDLNEYWQNLLKLKEQQIFDQENKRFKSKKFDDIWSMAEDELLKIYYEGLLSRSGKNVKTASKKAGKKETTFRARLDKLKIPYRRSQITQV